MTNCCYPTQGVRLLGMGDELASEAAARRAESARRDLMEQRDKAEAARIREQMLAATREAALRAEEARKDIAAAGGVYLGRTTRAVGAVTVAAIALYGIVRVLDRRAKPRRRSRSSARSAL